MELLQGNKILSDIIESAMSIAEESSWQARFRLKRSVDKLLQEWVSLNEHVEMNRTDNAQLRETAHQALHYVCMDQSALKIQPYHPCPECFQKRKKQK